MSGRERQRLDHGRHRTEQGRRRVPDPGRGHPPRDGERALSGPAARYFRPRVSLDGGEPDGGGSRTAAAPDRAAPARRTTRSKRRPALAQKPVRRPWSRSQERLALLYNEQGLRPEEIARRLRLSTYTVTQIILSAKNRKRR